MAAAGLSRSRGVAGVRATKGPFFILTLMCVVGLASSWIDKDPLVHFLHFVYVVECAVLKLRLYLHIDSHSEFAGRGQGRGKEIKTKTGLEGQSVSFQAAQKKKIAFFRDKVL